MRPQAGAQLLRPLPPWRESRTWCGFPPEGLAIVSAEAFAALCREEDTRANFIGRLYVAAAAIGPATGWDKDPVAVTLDCTSSGGDPRRAMLRPELRALAALAARHRKEFRTLLEAEVVLQALADGPG